MTAPTTFMECNTASITEAALFYNSQGLNVVKNLPRLKKPFEEDWPNLKYNEENIKREFSGDINIGIRGDETGLTGIDFDDERFKKAVMKKLPMLEDTLQSKGKKETGHYWVRLNKPLKEKSIVLCLADKTKKTFADLRSIGGQIVVAPSVHPDGMKYQWLNDNPILGLDTDVYLDGIDAGCAAVGCKNPYREIMKKPYTPTAGEEDIFEAVKARVSIGEVLSTNKKRIDCIAHKETTPSAAMRIYHNTNSVHCFSCLFSGDVIAVYAKMNNLKMIEAAKELAKRYCPEVLPKEPEKQEAKKPEAPKQEPEKESEKSDDPSPPPEPSRPSLTYRTNHLPHFDEFKKAGALYGDGYEVPMKVAYYADISAAIPLKTIELGDVRTDSRISGLFVLPSGRGKLNLVRLMKIPAAQGAAVSEPTSYHPEQLVGKMVERQRLVDIVDPGKLGDTPKTKTKMKKILIPNPGYLYDRILILEEALALLKSTQQDEKECRGHLARALDRLGDNYIFKRQVDQLRGEGLGYYATAQINFILQPIPVDDEIFRQGLMRRPLLVCPRLNYGEAREQEFNGRINGTNDSAAMGKMEFSKYLSGLDGDRIKDFSPDCRELIRKCHAELYAFGRSHSAKGAAYTESFANTLCDHLVKMSVLLAIAGGHERVEEEHVLLAHGDLLEIFASSLDYVKDYVRGEVAYKTVNEPNEKENAILTYLQDDGATSREVSKVGIAEVQSEIIMRWEFKGDDDSKERGARRVYSSMKRKGLIADHKGKYDSQVWLVHKPSLFVPVACNFAKYAQSQSVVPSAPSAPSAGKWDGLKQVREDSGGREDKALGIGKIQTFTQIEPAEVELDG